MGELTRQSQRVLSNYKVTVEPLLLAEPDGARHSDGWSHLTVLDINGAPIHTTYLRAEDVPQEVALAVERAERMRLESMFAAQPKGKR